MSNPRHRLSAAELRVVGEGWKKFKVEYGLEKELRDSVASGSESDSFTNSRGTVDVMDVYKHLSAETHNGLIARLTLAGALHELSGVPLAFWDPILDVYEESDGIVNLKACMAGVATCTNANAESKLRFCFKLFANSSPVVDKVQVTKMFEAIYKMGDVHASLKKLLNYHKVSEDGSMLTRANSHRLQRSSQSFPSVQEEDEELDDRSPAQATADKVFDDVAMHSNQNNENGIAVHRKSKTPRGTSPLPNLIERRGSKSAGNTPRNMPATRSRTRAAASGGDENGVEADVKAALRGKKHKPLDYISFKDLYRAVAKIPLAVEHLTRVTAIAELELRSYPASRVEEAQIIYNLREEHSRLSIGDTVYVISAVWWRNWEDYTKYNVVADALRKGEEPSLPERPSMAESSLTADSIGSFSMASGGAFSPSMLQALSMNDRESHTSSQELTNPSSTLNIVFRPSLIDNSEIVTAESLTTLEPLLRKNLIENNDYVIVCGEVWKQLSAWYGGGPAIARRIIRRSMQRRQSLIGREYIKAKGTPATTMKGDTVATRVELYPLQLKISVVYAERWKRSTGGSKAGSTAAQSDVEEDVSPSKSTYDATSPRPTRAVYQLRRGGAHHRDNSLSLPRKREGAAPITRGHRRNRSTGNPTDNQELFARVATESDTFFVSKDTRGQPLVSVIRKRFDHILELGSETRLWNSFNEAKPELIENMDKTLEELAIVDGQRLVLEIRSIDTSWPLSSTTGKVPTMETVISPRSKGRSVSPSPLSPRSLLQVKRSEGEKTSRPTSPRRSSKVSVSTAPMGAGHVGFTNLGNTCFMNAALQCITHTPGIVSYFLNEGYERDLNPKNPLGMKGEIATEYAKVLRELWYSKYKEAVAPRKLKAVISRYAPQFDGYGQHDSQELLGFLLDGLHEDLNKIVTKPYMDAPETEGRPDDDVAEEFWEQHMRRNRSTIVFLFQGQLTSQVTCLSCSYKSKTFDPYTFLSLPVPKKARVSVKVWFVRADGRRYACKLAVLKSGTVRDLKHKMESLGGLDNLKAGRLQVAALQDKALSAIFAEDESIAKVLEAEQIVVYELTYFDPESHFILQVILRDVGTRRSILSLGSIEIVGIPLLVVMSKTITHKELYMAVKQVLKSHLVNYKALEREMETTVTSLPRNSVQQGFSRSESGRAVPDLLRLPYELKMTRKDGKACAQCTWIKGCTGCALEGDTELIDPLGDCTVAVDLVSPTNTTPTEREMVDHSSLEDAEPKSKSVDLESCMQSFSDYETLEEDSYFCSKEKDFKPAIKTLGVWRAPPVLIVHLKRFEYDSSGQCSKIDTMVNFPVDDLWDVSEFLGDARTRKNIDTAIFLSNLYQLYGVVHHLGGLHSGHYIAHVRDTVVQDPFMDIDSGGSGNSLNSSISSKKSQKTEPTSEWWCYDDSRCYPISSSEVMKKSAYLLFFQRVNGMDEQDEATPVVSQHIIDRTIKRLRRSSDTLRSSGASTASRSHKRRHLRDSCKQQ
eukprot:Clim_evm14s241 gene=Clim_evmTU14s241